MTSGKQSTRRDNRTFEANDNERDYGLVLAMSARRRRDTHAGKLRAIFKQSPAQFHMRFQDFQKPARRNKILADLGLEPIHLPLDRKPSRITSVTTP